MFLFILDSLGNTELLVILVAALVFFGPRKLPQLSRTIGKRVTEFRRASDDFKRTWAQEVALEGDDRKVVTSPAVSQVDASMLGATVQRNAVQAAAEETTGTDSLPVDDPISQTSLDATASAPDEINEPAAEPSRKKDWL